MLALSSLLRADLIEQPVKQLFDHCCRAGSQRDEPSDTIT